MKHFLTVIIAVLGLTLLFNPPLCLSYIIGIVIAVSAIIVVIIGYREDKENRAILKASMENIDSLKIKNDNQKEAHIKSVISYSMRKFIEDKNTNFLNIIALPEPARIGWKNAILNVVSVELGKIYPNEADKFDEWITKELPKELR